MFELARAKWQYSTGRENSLLDKSPFISTLLRSNVFSSTGAAHLSVFSSNYLGPRQSCTPALCQGSIFASQWLVRQHGLFSSKRQFFFLTTCCFVYSHSRMAPLTWTLRERMIPSCGISTHWSISWIKSTGIPSRSFLENKANKQATKRLGGAVTKLGQHLTLQ